MFALLGKGDATKQKQDGQGEVQLEYKREKGSRCCFVPHIVDTYIQTAFSTMYLQSIVCPYG